jgi:hypothetical protein
MSSAVVEASRSTGSLASPQRPSFSVRRFSAVADAFGDLPLEKACDWATGARPAAAAVCVRTRPPVRRTPNSSPFGASISRAPLCLGRRTELDRPAELCESWGLDGPHDQP